MSDKNLNVFRNLGARKKGFLQVSFPKDQMTLRLHFSGHSSAYSHFHGYIFMVTMFLMICDHDSPSKKMSPPFYMLHTSLAIITYSARKSYAGFPWLMHQHHG